MTVKKKGSPKWLMWQDIKRSTPCLRPDELNLTSKELIIFGFIITVNK